MFSVVNGVLLRPLPVADQDRVMVMWGEHPAREFPHTPFLRPMLEEYSAETGPSRSWRGSTTTAPGRARCATAASP
jgi:hypothetical protein